MTLYRVLLLSQFILYSISAPQEPEINDQFQTQTSTDTPDTTTTTVSSLNVTQGKANSHIIPKMYRVLRVSITKIIEAPKVQSVLKNVGTCIVNGAMELVSFYFPAPIIPLLASAAGMLIPFEPVVTLRRQMPVTSYRRAFNSAVNGFLNTFDAYKHFDEDPYMTRRFSRRFLKDSGEKLN